uniref:Uncharacterized protein n=1 Tax=Oryza barthii TaxID=65489 RepID=A0A0D3FP50_9ORYZ
MSLDTNCGHLDWRRNRQECSIRMIALCAIVDVAKAKVAREPWSSRTVKDETSHRVCQTRGQLGTNARNSVANTARARQETTMNHTPMSEETSREGLRDVRTMRLSMPNGDEDNESGEAAVREDNTAPAPCRCSGKKSTGDVEILRRAPLSTTTTSGGVDHRQRHCDPRGANAAAPQSLMA